MRALNKALDARPEDYAISTFNDAPGRTQAEVIDLFTRAIDAVIRERESADPRSPQNG
jgi:hypothetical protein